MEEKIRVRFAPSPTGLLHIGGARTALFNWLYAKKYGGKFILRIEDTDKARSKENYEIDIVDGLSWLGLGWDEGPETPDLFGPYKQSDRLPIYKRYAEQLLKDKLAYKCFCTEEELEAERAAQVAAKQAPKYSGRCRSLKPEEIKKFEAEGRKPAIRFLVKVDGKISFNDLVHGKLEFDPKLIGDFIIVKSDGDPIFMFAGTIDDALMKISHVIRGDDHLSNTPKQIMLAKALNLPIPDYGHLPLILNPDKSKLSKRKNPTSLSKDYKDQGYLPEAIVNFLCLLGWSPSYSEGAPKDKKGIFSLDDLVSEFDLQDIGKSPAIFDQEKLDFLNGYYIRHLQLGELAKRCLPFLEKAGLVKKENEMVLKAVGLVQERMKKLSEVSELTSFFFKKPDFKEELLIPKKSDKNTTLKALKVSYEILEKEADFGRDSTEGLLRAAANKAKIDAGQILWPIRVALSGKSASPGTFELLGVLGKKECLERIKSAIDMLE